MVSKSFKDAYVAILQEDVMKEGVIDKIRDSYRSGELGDALRIGAIAASVAGSGYMYHTNKEANANILSNVNTHAQNIVPDDHASIVSHLKSIGASDEEAHRGALAAKAAANPVYPKAHHIAAAMTTENGKLRVKNKVGFNIDQQAKITAEYLKNRTEPDKDGKLQDVGHIGDRDGVSTVIPQLAGLAVMTHLATKDTAYSHSASPASTPTRSSKSR